MRYVFTLFCLAQASPTIAQELPIDKLAAGQVGRLAHPGKVYSGFRPTIPGTAIKGSAAAASAIAQANREATKEAVPFVATVDQVISPNSVIVRTNFEDRLLRIDGIADAVDGQRIDARQMFKVVGTTQIGVNTMFHLRTLNEKELSEIRQKEAEEAERFAAESAKARQEKVTRKYTEAVEAAKAKHGARMAAYDRERSAFLKDKDSFDRASREYDGAVKLAAAKAKYEAAVKTAKKDLAAGSKMVEAVEPELKRITADFAGTPAASDAATLLKVGKVASRPLPKRPVAPVEPEEPKLILPPVPPGLDIGVSEKK